MLRSLSGRFTGLLAGHRRLSVGSEDIDRHEFGAPPSHPWLRMSALPAPVVHACRHCCSAPACRGRHQGDNSACMHGAVLELKHSSENGSAHNGKELAPGGGWEGRQGLVPEGGGGSLNSPQQAPGAAGAKSAREQTDGKQAAQLHGAGREVERNIENALQEGLERMTAGAAAGPATPVLAVSVTPVRGARRDGGHFRRDSGRLSLDGGHFGGAGGSLATSLAGSDSEFLVTVYTPRRSGSMPHTPRGQRSFSVRSLWLKLAVHVRPVDPLYRHGHRFLSVRASFLNTAVHVGPAPPLPKHA